MAPLSWVRIWSSSCFMQVQTPRRFISGKFESDEGFDFSLQGAANRKIATIRQFKCHAYRVAFFPSFERNRLANAAARAGKIPTAPFLIESLHRYHAFRVANRQWDMKGYGVTSE